MKDLNRLVDLSKINLIKTVFRWINKHVLYVVILAREALQF
jgi:hypothetical protein